MKCSYACQSVEHRIARRQFLGAMAGMGGLTGLGCLTHSLAAAHLAAQKKRVLTVFLSGGLSQLESWDPKPGTLNGGPFRAIRTSVPGIHISELLPKTAQHMHPTGTLLATAGNDLVVKLWDATTGALIHSMEGHEKHIYSLMFHPDGKLLLSGDLAGRIYVWEVAGGKKLRTLDAKDLHTYHGGQKVDYGGIRCMTLSPDGKQLACGGLHKGTNPFAGVQEPLVVVLDWESGKLVRTHEATQIDRGIVWRLCHLPDGTLMGASGGGSGGFLLFWNDQDKNEVHKFKLPNTVLDMDYHGPTITVATAHHDGHLRISKLAAKEP